MAVTIQETMMSTIQEQQALWLVFASKTAASAMKVGELNMRMMQASINDSTQLFQRLLVMKAPSELLNYDAQNMQLQLDRMMSYAKEMNALLLDLTSQFSLITETNVGHVAHIQKSAKATHAATPENMQHPFELMLSALDSVTNGYKQWMDVSQKMAEAAGHHFPTSASSATPHKRTVKAH